MTPEINRKRLWEEFSLHDMLIMSVFYLDYRDGYDKYGEGSRLANAGDYEVEYHEEYDLWVVKHLPTNKIIYREPPTGWCEMRLLEILLNGNIGGCKFNTLYYDKETFVECLLEKIGGIG
jgi:hypothetical protein